jgi:hypothetical protein
VACMLCTGVLRKPVICSIQAHIYLIFPSSVCSCGMEAHQGNSVPADGGGGALYHGDISNIVKVAINSELCPRIDGWRFPAPALMLFRVCCCAADPAAI